MVIDMETGERLDLQAQVTALGVLHELEQDRRISKLEEQVRQLLEKEKDNGNSKSSEDRV